MSDKKGWSEEKTDILGHKYAQHYDEHGDKTGWSEGRTGILGGKRTQDYDRGPAGIRASQEGEPEKSRHSGARSRTSYSQGSSPSFSKSPNSTASSSSGLSIPGVVGSVIVLGIVAVFIYNALPPSVTTLPKIQKSASGQSCAPVEVIAPGACPFEGCQYGKWTAREAVPIYSIPGGPRASVGIACVDQCCRMNLALGEAGRVNALLQ
jgi:hypothetical protein